MSEVPLYSLHRNFDRGFDLVGLSLQLPARAGSCLPLSHTHPPYLPLSHTHTPSLSLSHTHRPRLERRVQEAGVALADRSIYFRGTN